jgi:hypothetical protein
MTIDYDPPACQERLISQDNHRPQLDSLGVNLLRTTLGRGPSTSTHQHLREVSYTAHSHAPTFTDTDTTEVKPFVWLIAENTPTTAPPLSLQSLHSAVAALRFDG